MKENSTIGRNGNEEGKGKGMKVMWGEREERESGGRNRKSSREGESQVFGATTGKRRESQPRPEHFCYTRRVDRGLDNFC